MTGGNSIIGCVGMTHLGINYSCAFADKNYNLICYDSDENIIKQLRNGYLLVNEPGLAALHKKNKSCLFYTSCLEDLAQCDIIFIAYDVPTNDQGLSDLHIVNELLVSILPVVNEQSLVVLLSQVPPGFTRNINFDKKRLFYQVETLIFGRAVERACFPERYIVGQMVAGQPLPKIYRDLLDSFGCPIFTMVMKVRNWQRLRLICI